MRKTAFVSFSPVGRAGVNMRIAYNSSANTNSTCEVWIAWDAVHQRLLTGSAYRVRDAPTGISRLPQELIDLIVDNLSRDAIALRSCSFVRRAWLKQCRHHLLRVRDTQVRTSLRSRPVLRVLSIGRVGLEEHSPDRLFSVLGLLSTLGMLHVSYLETLGNVPDSRRFDVFARTAAGLSVLVGGPLVYDDAVHL
ncbi:hypothetical protein BDY19DRAFT_998741 [Irpex rosettiformis]|uniref:Uncharacterized protein n=1 Tax=Irpex rosettiformis TaxID=378272 RepID=A0ACB8TMH8_9APHY|nr:hypothetical protein BDY19DRAFT_998741 [Irpex rosettiformis]